MIIQRAGRNRCRESVWGAEATDRLMTGMALVSPHELLTYKVNSLDRCIMPVDHGSSYFDQRTRVRVQ